MTETYELLVGSPHTGEGGGGCRFKKQTRVLSFILIKIYVKCIYFQQPHSSLFNLLNIKISTQYTFLKWIVYINYFYS